MSALAFTLVSFLLAVPNGAVQDPTAPSASAPDAQSFERDYVRAEHLTASRRWRDAGEAWTRLLEQHAGASYVRPRLPEIRERLRTCAFWLGRREPELASLVHGKLLSYDALGGRIRIQYGAHQLGDLVDEGTQRMHPMRMRGPYTLQLEGTAAELASPFLVLALGDDEVYVVQLGEHWTGESEYRPHALTLYRSKGDPVQLGQSIPAESSREETARATIGLGAKEIYVEYDGERVLAAQRSGRGFGRWGIQASEPFGTLVASGTIELEWIDGLIDQRVQRERERFDASYVPPAALAAWPSAPATESVSSAVQRWLVRLPIPADLAPEEVALIDRAAAALEAGRSADALAMLANASEAELPAEPRRVALALCETLARRPRRALEHLGSIESQIAGPELLFLRAHSLAAIERGAEAVGILESLLAEPSVRSLASVELATVLLDLGERERARAAIETAVANDGATAELEDLRDELVRATLGPSWRRGVSAAGQFFRVETDTDVAYARLAVRELDETFRRCCKAFGDAPPPAAPTRALVFAGRSSYVAYTEDVVGEGLPRTAGVYDTRLDQLAMWNQPSRADSLRTLRHECVHRYVDVALGLTPRWFNEGLAEYVAASKRDDGTWQDGAIDAAHVRALRSAKLLPIDEFVHLSDEEFLASPADHYAQSWALVHFLRKGRSAAASGLFARLWTALAQPTDAQSALEEALSGVDLDALETAFRAHVRTLVEER